MLSQIPSRSEIQDYVQTIIQDMYIPNDAASTLDAADRGEVDLKEEITLYGEAFKFLLEQGWIEAQLNQNEELSHLTLQNETAIIDMIQQKSALLYLTERGSFLPTEERDALMPLLTTYCTLLQSLPEGYAHTANILCEGFYLTHERFRPKNLILAEAAPLSLTEVFSSQGVAPEIPRSITR